MTVHGAAAPFDTLNFYARMAGAELLASGHHVAQEDRDVYRADFVLLSRPETRSVRFEEPQRHIEATPDLTMKQAAYIVALSARKNGGILRLPATMTERDKLRLYMAAQTHHLRVLVEKLERDSITAAERQLLGHVVRGEAALPVVEVRDGAPCSKQAYSPPPRVVQLDLLRDTRTEKSADDAVADLRIDLCLRAVRKDRRLSAAVSEAPETKKAVVGVSPVASGEQGSLLISAVIKFLQWVHRLSFGEEHQGAVRALHDDLVALRDGGQRKIVCPVDADFAQQGVHGFVERMRACLRNVGNASAAAESAVVKPMAVVVEPVATQTQSGHAATPANPPSQGGLLAKFANFARSVMARRPKPTGSDEAKRRLQAVLRRDRESLVSSPS